VHVDAEDVSRQLLGRARWSASRSSGPGGQHRDKASTRAELTLDLDALEGLETDVAERLARGLGLTERPLRIQVQDERSLARNQEIAAQRLAELVANALAPPPAARRATRPTRAARRERLDQKARRSRVKRTRRPELHDDEA
jgi:ribosome-associated protein